MILKSFWDLFAVAPRVPAGFVSACLLLGTLATVSCSKETERQVMADAKPVDVAAVRAKAQAGDAQACRDLGLLYAKGEGVEQSYKEAAVWYRLAAERGNAGAQFALGELYEAGQGVPVDDGESARWYRSAAEQGHPAGQYSLAVLYVQGKGVKKDIAEAVRWYRRAAEGGNGYAQYTLGLRYREGDGVAEDKVEAYQWLSLAAAQDMPDAARVCSELKKEMTREQVADSQRRIKAFSPKTTPLVVTR